MTDVQRGIAAACLMLSIAGNTASGAEAGRTTSQVATPPLATQSALPSATSQVLQVGPGDQVRVEVFGNPDLTTTLNVAEDGTLRMPLAGSVAVGGQSLVEAARRIEAAFKEGQILLNPQVIVTVVQSVSQRVTLLGEVGSPGRYIIEPNTTVLEMIALAGGVNDKGSDRVYVLRADSSGVLQRLPVSLRSIGSSQDPTSAALMTLKGGDSIIVPKGTFYISGQVSAPGEYRIEGDMLLAEAIARAGGVTELGSTSRVEVRRRGSDDQINTVKVNKNLRIEPGDMIRVKERIF